MPRLYGKEPSPAIAVCHPALMTDHPLSLPASRTIMLIPHLRRSTVPHREGHFTTPDGTDIFMPLSPKYLLFTEVGKDLPKRFIASDLHTYQIQRSIAKGALRMIFSHKQIPFINQLCPRIDNREMYREENEAWRKWHSQQSKAEQDLDESN